MPYLQGTLIYETHVCFFMTCLIAFSAIGHSGCQNHKNSHLHRIARELDETQPEHEEAGDLGYFASLDQHRRTIRLKTDMND